MKFTPLQTGSIFIFFSPWSKSLIKKIHSMAILSVLVRIVSKITNEVVDMAAVLLLLFRLKLNSCV